LQTNTSKPEEQKGGEERKIGRNVCEHRLKLLLATTTATIVELCSDRVMWVTHMVSKDVRVTSWITPEINMKVSKICIRDYLKSFDKNPKHR